MTSCFSSGSMCIFRAELQVSSQRKNEGVKYKQTQHLLAQSFSRFTQSKYHPIMIANNNRINRPIQQCSMDQEIRKINQCTPPRNLVNRHTGLTRSHRRAVLVSFFFFFFLSPLHSFSLVLNGILTSLVRLLQGAM